MTKNKLLYILGRNEDSIITIKLDDREKDLLNKRGEVPSSKIHIAVTTNFNNKHIKNLGKRKFNTNGNVLAFSWTENRFRIINPKNVLKIEPLSSILKNEKPELLRNG